MKRIYADAMGKLARRLTNLNPRIFSQNRSQNKLAHWLISLFAIHNVDLMIQLKSPWWTYQASEKCFSHLAESKVERERKGDQVRVFEWGSGASTVMLESSADRLISVEYDSDFYDYLSKLTGPKTSLLLLTGKKVKSGQIASVKSSKRGFRDLDFFEYASAIEAYPTNFFDLIVIDGRAREDCLRRSIGRVRPGGAILIDDMLRRRYRKAVGEIIPADTFSVEKFFGLTPSLPYPSSTWILVRKQDLS